MIITIDGPAGSGKSTTARAVARRLGFRHLDSGAFYRAITLAALRQGIPADEWPALGPERLDAFSIEARPAELGFELFIGEECVADAIRAADVTANVSRMARIPAIRDWLFGRLRAAATRTSLVTDGRDMGTVVFPEADLKIYLTADLPTRARRRLAEHGASDPSPDALEAEERRLAERDRRDSEREVAPLRPADDAVLVDTSALTFDEQVDRIVTLIRRHASPDTELDRTVTGG